MLPLDTSAGKKKGPACTPATSGRVNDLLSIPRVSLLINTACMQGARAAAGGRHLTANETAAAGRTLAAGPDDASESVLLSPAMTCTGGVIVARTCYFEDLLWDNHQQRFAFFGPRYTQPHMMTDMLLSADELDGDAPWIKLRRYSSLILAVVAAAYAATRSAAPQHCRLHQLASSLALALHVYICIRKWL